MRKNPRRILSPQRLPFRHPGNGTSNLTNRVPHRNQHGWPGGLRKDSGDLLAGCDSSVSSSWIGRRRKSPSYPAMLILRSPIRTGVSKLIFLAKRL